SGVLGPPPSTNPVNRQQPLATIDGWLIRLIPGPQTSFSPGSHTV
ncbi:hypothetical protein CTA1_2668, partial [Colletotrichum tanaceti]